VIRPLLALMKLRSTVGIFERTGAKLQPVSRPEPHQLSHRALFCYLFAHTGPAANGKTIAQREDTGALDFPGCVLT
jgi:hypothetical protein